MMTSHSKKKRETKQVDQKQARWTGNKQGGPEKWTRNTECHLTSYIRERKHHFTRNG